MGIAMLATILTRREDFHRAVLVEKITPYGAEAMNRLSQLTEMFSHQGWALPDARARALTVMSSQVDTQAAALSFADIAWLLAVFTACTIPFCFMLASGKRGAKVEMH
ncbi:MAG: hypothetical protein C0507_14630 [Cyanobacteria bacterium PR.3.49]|nr:hypothetical protein [Cyanobacteria bacterium PR.3.49]